MLINLAALAGSKSSAVGGLTGPQWRGGAPNRAGRQQQPFAAMSGARRSLEDRIGRLEQAAVDRYNFLTF